VLRRLVPESSDDSALKVADTDTERLLLLEATTGLFVAASNEAPVLIVLDDVHWADTATLQLLRHLVGATGPMNVTIVCSYRDTDLRRGDPLTRLLADLHREANVSRIKLDGLHDADVVELLEAAAGHVLDDAGVGLAHALRRETDGNPFFTGEILRHLGETSAIVVGDDGRWTVAGELDDLGLPRSVHDVIGRRVERLGEEAVRVLRLAAVIGREFEVELLAHMAEIGIDPLLDIVDSATSAAVLVEGSDADRYRFAHALIQHALYEELSPARRQRAHQRIAETLEARIPSDDPIRLAELARHWVAATRPAELGKALTYVQRAGDAALAALAPFDAARWYRQGLELLAREPVPDDHHRTQLLIALGTAQNAAGAPQYRATMLDAVDLAQRLGEDDLLVKAALGLTRFTGTVYGDAEANRVIAMALNTIGEDPTPTRARLLAALAETYDAAAQWRERREAALQAFDTARLASDDLTIVQVTASVHPALKTPDRQAEAIEALETAVRLADRTGDPILRAMARRRATWACYQQLDLERADRLIHELQELADDFGLPLMRFEYESLVAGRRLLAGAVEEAEAANAKLLEVGTAAGLPDTLVSWGGILYAITQHRGRLHEIAEFHLQAARDHPSVAALRSSVPAMLANVGRIDQARQHLADEAATAFDYPYDDLWLAAMANIADAAATVGDQPSARLLVDRLTPFAHHVTCPAGVLVLGAVARPLARAAALVGKHADAEQWFTLAHDIHRRLHAPYWEARGQHDHADLCLARGADGDAVRARNLATTAAATAAQYGCAGLATRAEILLAHL
jgi:tetratricopeptide (TPR) repeat protein